MMEKILSEAVEKISRLVERVRYRNDLLPSEANAELQSIEGGVKEGYGKNTPPAAWNDLVSTTRLFLTEGTKPQRIPGCAENLNSLIERDGKQLVDDERRRVSENHMVANGRAVRRTDWDRLSPAEAMAHVRSGGIVVD